ncbi:hypothetical protein [Acetobacterium bakii]|uniref:hypothetical protein n=1 Tax=Acetobacterium bakii TaxID=52689 RepID=UPI000F8F2AE8|nr:hypothetical protein [Acetobacterium bakii]
MSIQTRLIFFAVWDNIQLQYAAIIRAQNLMYVRDQEDKTIEKVGSSTGKVSSQTWEVQQAWDTLSIPLE